MGELGFNKIFGAALATFLFIFGLNELATRMFGEGGHHGEHEYESANDWAKQNFHGYRVEIAEATSGGAPEEEGPVFDLGLLLASADSVAGENVLSSQCSACHSWNEGGPNGTGPNLHGIVGKDIASTSGFTYSSALSGIEGVWTYEKMNEWLANPGGFARGTSMAYAGLRSPRRDNDRVNVIAYLASASPDAPKFPASLATDASAELPSEAAETALGILTDTANGLATEVVTDTEVPLREQADETAQDLAAAAEDAANGGQ